MAQLEKTITIDAPVEQVFRYIDEPENFPQFWPGLIEVKNIQPMSMGGHHFTWVYKMMGVRFHGTNEVLEYKFKHSMVCKTKGGISSIIIWLFEPVDGSTTVTFGADYRVPIPLLGRLAETLVTKQSEEDAETLLSNLKAIMEGETEAKKSA